MKGLNLVLIFIIGFFFTSCEVYEDLDVEEIKSVKIGTIKDGKLNLKITADVLNPNAYGIKLKETDLQVFLDDNFMGTAHLNSPVKLLRKQTKTYTFDVEVGLEKGVMAKLITLALKKEVMLKVKGDIKAGVMGISKTLKVSKTKTIDPAILMQR